MADKTAPKLETMSTGAVTLSETEAAREAKVKEMLKAVADGDVSQVKQLVKHGMSVHVADDSNKSAVWHALSNEPFSMPMLKVLFDAGAHPDYPDSVGSERAIEQAMTLGYDEASERAEVVEKLLEQRYTDGTRKVNFQRTHVKEESLLHRAAWMGNVGAIAALLQTGEYKGRLEERNKEGQTVMHVAAFRCKKAGIARLVEAGADPVQVERNGRRLSKETPESMAKIMGHEENAKFLSTFSGTLTALKFSKKMSNFRGNNASEDGADSPSGTTA